MRTAIEGLSDDAYAWIFGISPAVDEARRQRLLETVDAFLDGWTSHGSPIRAAGEIREGSFLIVAADPRSERSGCSIDRMFGTLRELERELGVAILDAGRVFYRDGGAVRAVPRSTFREVAGPDTPIFDTTAERLGEIRSGAWERRAADSWHRQLLGS